MRQAKRKKTHAFISYARADGAEFATELSHRLEADRFFLWRDLSDMEGGSDWQIQMSEALRNVEYLLLVLTRAAARFNGGPRRMSHRAGGRRLHNSDRRNSD